MNIISSALPELSIGIIGGGFSGTLVCVHLIELLESPATIFWWDKHNRFARGVAYGACDSWHLLNVRADKMGAYPENIAHFWQWLQTKEAQEITKTHFPEVTLSPEKFLPRKLYGYYLESLLQQAEKKAAQKGIVVRKLAEEVLAIEYEAESGFTAHAKMPQTNLRYLILATGNQPHKQLKATESVAHSPHFIAQSWDRAEIDPLLQRLKHFSPQDTGMIIGSGLTMVDLVISLRRYGFRGKIIALSRNGQLPQPHEATPSAAWQIDPTALKGKSLNELLIWLRKEIARAQAQNISWHAVIDALRPFTVSLWQALSFSEQRCVLKKYFTWWNIHRHRMAIEIKHFLEAEIKQEKLQIIAGSLKEMVAEEGSLRVHYGLRHNAEEATKQVVFCINCLGPETDFNRIQSPLLQQLRTQGLFQLDRHGLALCFEEDGSVKGEASGYLYALGNLRFTERFETTAVPELREQAAEVAQLIYAKIHK